MSSNTFDRSIAIVIGINEYQSGIPPLKTAVNDAQSLAKVLKVKHDYSVYLLLNQSATEDSLVQLLEKKLPQQIKAGDRLLFYFAGHGIALNGEDGPEGYLIPQGARLGDVSSYLSMSRVHDALHALPCRHFLGILDCCFAGSFRWSGTRKLVPMDCGIIHKERFDRFIQDPAWQILTSAAHDQEAHDAFDLKTDRGQIGKHSPFATALMEALQGKADAYPPADDGKPAGDGVITATELYLYLRDRVEIATEARMRQTPGIHPLKKHDKGEYIFLTPGHALNLPPAPPLDESKNPYRGLESFEEAHSDLFFGRSKLVEILAAFVKDHPLTVILGASGSGKSSLVKAGLIPELKQNGEPWHVLPAIRPGESPFQALNAGLAQAQFAAVEPASSRRTLVYSIAAWRKDHPDARLLLYIDQSEELMTLCQDEAIRKAFFQQILTAIHTHGDRLRVVLSLRSDFEPQIRDVGLSFAPEVLSKLGPDTLKNYWQRGRFVVPAMTRPELREAIEKPAEARVMFFQPHGLVDQLIDEVADMPGALPLLSFALSELYLKYLQRQHIAQLDGDIIDRALTEADYQGLGGVIQSLTERADQEYHALVETDDAYGETIRNVMLRMVAIGGELARRRVPRSELKYADPDCNSRVDTVLQRFVEARLIVTDIDRTGDRYYEPAHDYLINAWTKLTEWIRDERTNLTLQRQLTPAAVKWESLKNHRGQVKAQNQTQQTASDPQEPSREKPAKFLWNANPYLDVLSKTLKSDRHWFNQTETEFIRRSFGKRCQNSRIRQVAASSVILGLTALSFWALYEQRKAVINQVRNARQASEAGLTSNNFTFDTLIQSLQAAKSQENWLLRINPPESQLQEQVLDTLRKAVYLNREQNHWQIPQGEAVRSTFINSNSQLLLTTTEDEDMVCIQDLSSDERWCEELSESANLTNDIQFRLGERITLVNNAQFSPDGEKAAWIGELSGDFANVYVWNWKEERISQHPKGNDEFDFTFGPDSNSIVFIDNCQKNDEAAQALCQWNWEENRVYVLDNNIPERVVDFGYSSNGSLLLTTQNLSSNNEFTVGLQQKEGPRWEPLGEFTPTVSGMVERTVINPSGGGAVITYSRGSAGSGTEIWLTNGYSTSLEPSPKAVYSPDGNRLAVANDNGTIQVYKGGPQPEELRGHQGLISNMSFSQDGKQLLTVGNDNTIRLWNVDTGSNVEVQELKKGVDLPNPVQKLAFSSDSNQLITLENDKLYLRNVSDNLSFSRQVSQKSYSEAGHIVFHPDGQQLAISMFKGDNTFQIMLLDLESGQEAMLPGEYSSVDSLSFDPDGERLAVLERVGDGTNSTSNLYVLDLANLQENTGQPVKETLPSGAEGLIWRSDENSGENLLLFVAPSMGENIEVWDIFPKEPQQIASLLIGQNVRRYMPGDGISLVKDGSLASIQIGQNTTLWDWQADQRIGLIHRRESDIPTRLAIISPDGSKLAIFDEQGKVEIVQLGDFHRLFELGCEQVYEYLQTGSNVDNRNLCDGVSFNQPEPSAAFSPPEISRQIQPSTEIQPGDNSSTLSERASMTAEELLQRGYEKFQQEDYQGAIEDYSQAIQLTPDYAEAYNARGVAYANFGNRQLAIEDYTRAIELNPDFAVAYSNRGSSYHALGDREKAAADYQKAVELYQQQGDTEKRDNAKKQVENLRTAVYEGNGYTITINGFGQNASYKGCTSNNNCLEIPQVSAYSNGSYVWNNGGTQYFMSQIVNGDYQLKVVGNNGETLEETTVSFTPQN